MNTNTTEIAAEHPPAREPRAPVVWLLLCAGLVHVPTLFNAFFIDDYVYIETVQDIDVAQLIDMFTTSTMDEKAAGVWWTPKGVLPFYRPIGELSFAVDYHIWGLRPLGFHLTNLVLHLGCTILVWRLARRLLSSDARRGGWPIVVAIVFSLHPVHNEAVAWISGRFDLLVAACVLASTIAFLNARRSTGPWIRWLILSLLWFVLGLGCKETALMMPAFIVVLEILRWRDGDPAASHGRAVARVAGFGAVAAMYLVMRFALFGGLGHLPPPYGIDWTQPIVAGLTVLWSLLQYLLDFVLFVQVDAFYIAPFWLSHPLLLSICAVITAVVIAATAWLSRGGRVFVTGVSWTLLFTAPALMAMPGERNVYLASVGAALAATAGLYGLAERLRQRRNATRWLRRASAALLVVWIGISQVEFGAMWCLASAGENVLRDIEAAMPDPPENARIYVVNQCPLSAIGFDQALKLRFGRGDILGCALSLSPTLEASTHDRIVQTGARSIRLERNGGDFFASAIELFHMFSQPVSGFPDGCRRWDLTLLDPPSSIEALNELHFEFPYDLGDDRLRLFVWDNKEIRDRRDYPALAKRGILRPFHPVETIGLTPPQ